MANNRFQTIPVTTTLEDLAKHNSNWDKADAELTSHQNQITAEQQERIAAVNAHIQAIVAHAAGAISLSPVSGMSASNLQAAVAELRNILTTIIAGPAPSAAEIQAARVGADNIARASLDILIKEIHGQQIAAATQTASLKHGLNYLLSSEASPLNVTIYGRTLVNLLGNTGNMDDHSKFSVSGCTLGLNTANALYGTNAMALTLSSAFGSATVNFTFESGKYYVLIVEGKKGTASAVYTTVAGVGNGTSVTSSSYGVSYQKIVGDGTTKSVGVAANGASGNIAYFDGLRVFEVDATTYNAIGVSLTESTSPSLQGKLPYVDSIKHVQNPVITKPGKNLLPPFTEWTLHANAVVTELYKLTLNATATGQNSWITIPIVGGQTVTFSVGVAVNGARYFDVRMTKADGTYTTSTFNSGTSKTITLAADITSLAIISVNVGAGEFTWTNPQLELGSTATAFEPRNGDSIMASVVLASNLDGTVRDSLTYRDGLWRKTKRFVPGYVLDGSLPWILHNDQTGFKNVRIDNFANNDMTSSPGSNNTFMVKFNGQTLPYVNNNSNLDNYFVGVSGTRILYISIADTDSGWTESLNPNVNAVKAHMNGWKANGNNGTVYNSWISVLDGSAPTTNTEAWVAANKAPNWIGWATISYQLAQAVDEIIPVEGSISLHQGGNQVELSEGVIVREKVTPQKSTLYEARYIAMTNGFHGSNGNQTKYRVSKIIAVYKNGVIDTKWSIKTGSTGDYGSVHAEIPEIDFDTTAEYTVTYIALDKYAITTNVIDVTAEYNSNAKMAQDQLVRRVADAETNITVVVNAVAELYKRMKALGG